MRRTNPRKDKKTHWGKKKLTNDEDNPAGLLVRKTIESLSRLYEHHEHCYCTEQTFSKQLL